MFHTILLGIAKVRIPKELPIFVRYIDFVYQCIDFVGWR